MTAPSPSTTLTLTLPDVDRLRSGGKVRKGEVLLLLDPDDVGLWTARDVAAHTGKTTRTVELWARRGKIPCVRNGARTYYVETRVKAWWEMRRNG